MLKTKDGAKINRLKNLPPARCKKCGKRKSYTNPLEKCFECGKKFCYNHLSSSYYNSKKMNMNSELKSTCEKCRDALGIREGGRELNFKNSYTCTADEEIKIKFCAYILFEVFKESMGSHADKYDDKEIERIKKIMESLADHVIDYIYRETDWGHAKEDPKRVIDAGGDGNIPPSPIAHNN